MTEVKNSSRWRTVLFAVWVFALASVVYSAWGITHAYGMSGITIVGTAGQEYLQRIEVSPHSPAARARLRTGDVLDVRPMTGSDRYQLLYAIKFAGSQMHLYVLRAGRLSQLTVTAAPNPASRWDWFLRFGMAGIAWIILFAGLLVWRRPDNADARILSLLLMLMVLASTLHPFDSVLPWPVLDTAKNALHFLLLFYSVLLGVYMMRFARPASSWRKILFALACAAWAASVLSGWVAIAGAWSGIQTLETAQFANIQNALLAALNVCVLLCGIATAVQCRGAERTRFLWAFVPLATLYIAGISQNLAQSVPNPNSAWLEASHVAVNVAFFLTPLGLTYSVLSRRLLDIGFVLNRAAIFSGVSIVVVGLFVLAEWALSEWMRTASHETNIAVSAALALLLGLSIRFVHAKVEHIVDHVMFRKRREDEEAIRRMAREAPYITDRATLLARAERVLLQHADSSAVSFLLDDGHGLYGTVDENDPALVSLRTDHTRVDLHTLETSIAGEWAYPMVARGRLVGALVLGPKRSQESYAPDESAAITQLASSVGGALDVLAANGDPEGSAIAQLTKAVTALATTVSDGFEQLGVANLERTGR